MGTRKDLNAQSSFLPSPALPNVPFTLGKQWCFKENSREAAILKEQWGWAVSETKATAYTVQLATTGGGHTVNSARVWRSVVLALPTGPVSSKGLSQPSLVNSNGGCHKGSTFFMHLACKSSYWEGRPTLGAKQPFDCHLPPLLCKQKALNSKQPRGHRSPALSTATAWSVRNGLKLSTV